MKRIALIFTTALFVMVTMTSCLKTRTCECRSVSNPGLNQNYSVGPGSLKKAKADCENYQFDYSSTLDYTCSLQ
jgi:hypothetical protein